MSKALSPQAPVRTHINAEIWGYMALAALWAYALIRPAMMWDWEYYHDTPLLNYAGVLMHDFGQVPYRDFFETTMPGTFLFHYIIVGLGLETQTAFVTLGILAMFALAGAGSLILWRINHWAGLVFAPFYLMVMFQFGPSALFQREILGLLAMSPALLVATRTGTIPYLWQQGLVGLLFGIACTIKPQFALGAPVAVLCLAALSWDKDSSASAVRIVVSGILASVIGFSLPLAVAFWWLWSYGALENFWFIVTEYTPLYIQQTESHGFIPAELRPFYISLLWTKFAGFWTLLPGVALLLFVTIGYHTRISRQNLILLRTIIALVVVYGLVPILSGQFWGYHYYPFIFFAILAVSALLGMAFEPILSKPGQIACITLAAFCIAHNFSHMPELERRQENQKTRITLAKDMETSLRKWVPEGGHVHPIDWAEGALHALMRARIPIATRFFYEFHFAHHVSTDVNAALRAELMDSLSSNPPEVILLAHNRSKVYGLDVSYDFPELDAFRDSRYRRVEQNKLYDIYLRRDLAS